MENTNNVNNIEHRYRYYNHLKENSRSNNLDKDAFIRLLVTQLKNQDPLSPMEDKEFIAQMAQFTALEQMQNMNENLKNTKETLAEHITMMNNNMVKSHTFMSQSLDSINKTLLELKDAISTTNYNKPVEEGEALE